MKLLIALVWLPLVATAHAASFDCAKAGTKVEHIICNDPQISHMDEQLAQNYKTALQDQSNAKLGKQEQRQWMKERNVCADVACVQEAYRKRIAQLSTTQGIEKEKPIAIMQRQTPPEVASVERWFKENKQPRWPNPSHLYVSVAIEGDHVCGLLFSSAMGTNRLDRSLLVGRVASGRIEVQYASSYYSKQKQVATAHLERHGDQLHWKPIGSGLSTSGFWGDTLLSHTDKPYAPLTKWHYERCKALRDKTSIEAIDLHLDP
ncbi:MAG: hypothetical protein A2100_00130 [Sideroxydans sp. GWF2_59_14]|nr:MAG: hypothetical protein A2100_00130 [Sideroxydans sp. GWF2_59_14]HAF45131.1 hypothetical protein [Gallionellaceae bacterium]